jgi:hypothetical protein
MTRPGASLPRSARMSRRRRLGLYFVGLGLWLSGGLWLLFHHFLLRQGELGLSAHPLEPWWLKVHGALAFASLWVLGLLWGVHVREGWALRLRRPSGAVLLGALALLIVSGYLLYYLGNEDARAITSIVHWGVGLAVPIAYSAHRVSPRIRPRSSRKARVT